jgi:hypothetical protein
LTGRLVTIDDRSTKHNQGWVLLRVELSALRADPGDVVLADPPAAFTELEDE